MAQCPHCKRNLPLSGKCPFCEARGTGGGFSLRTFSRGPDGAPPAPPAPAPPPEPVFPREPAAGPAAPPPARSDAASPLKPPVPSAPPAPPARLAAPPSPPLTSPPGLGRPGGILASLSREPGRAGDTTMLPPPRPPLPSSLMPPAPEPVSPYESVLEAAPPAPAPRPVFGTDNSADEAPSRVTPPTDDGSVPGSDPEPGHPAAPTRVLPGGATPPPGGEGRRPTLASRASAPPQGISLAPTASEAASPDQSPFVTRSTGPADDEMECTMLAGILTDPFILDKVRANGLIPELFASRYARAVCRSILALREENREGTLIDRIVIKNKLKQQNLFDEPMQAYLNRVLAQPAPTINQVLHYLQLMKDAALRRKLKEVADDIGQFVEHPDPSKPVSLENFTNQVIKDIRGIQRSRTYKRINLVKDEMRDIVNDIERREREGEVEIIGYSFAPFNILNQALSGFRKGFLYAIAGAPRRGKTTFTLELATNVATNCKIPVLFFTYEQTKKNLTYRLLAKESRLNPNLLQRKKVRSDMITDAKFMGGWRKMQGYMDYFYIIEATKEDTVDRIRSYAYNVMQDFNSDQIMIFVDYIQKMPLSRSYNDEKFKVEELSTELKGLTIELNNPIMVISSLSKDGCMIDATESQERPTMYHCKGSGDIEYDLDCAMIQSKDWADTHEIYNQLKHKAEELGKDPTRIPKVDVVNLYLDKNRDAPEGIFSVVQYMFFIEDNKFIELGPKYEDEQYRFAKIEQLVDQLISNNYIVFHDKDRSTGIQKGRVQIKLKNM